MAVVGAGPAGSVTALVLARGGARVALVDKAAFPRDKACGDAIGPRAVAVLDDLGLTPAGERAPLGDMVVVGPSGRRLRLPCFEGIDYPGYGYAIPRLGFDAWLVDEALGAGAVPVTGRVQEIGVAAARRRSRPERWRRAARGRARRRPEAARRRGDRCRRGHEPRRRRRGFGRLPPGAVGVRGAGLHRRACGVAPHRVVAAGARTRLPRLRMALSRSRRARQRRARHRHIVGPARRSGRGAIAPRLSRAPPAHGPPRQARRRIRTGAVGGLAQDGHGGHHARGGAGAAHGGRGRAREPVAGRGHRPRHDEWAPRRRGGAGRARWRRGALSRRHRASSISTTTGSPSAAHATLVGRPAAAAVVGRVLTHPLVGRPLAGGWSVFWNELLDGTAAGDATHRRRCRLGDRPGRDPPQRARHAGSTRRGRRPDDQDASRTATGVQCVHGR